MEKIESKEFNENDLVMMGIVYGFIMFVLKKTNDEKLIVDELNEFLKMNEEIGGKIETLYYVFQESLKNGIVEERHIQKLVASIASQSDDGKRKKQFEFAFNNLLEYHIEKRLITREQKTERFKDELKKQLDDSRHEGYDRGFLDALWVVIKISDEPALIALLLDDWLSLADNHRDLFEELNKKSRGDKQALKDVLYKLRWAISEEDTIANKEVVSLIDEAIEHYCD